MHFVPLLITLAIGLLAGWLAHLVVGGRASLVSYLISGLLGAFVGSYLLSGLGIYLRLGLPYAMLEQIVSATIGAIVVILLARLILRG